jgi:nucleoside-diphosphate-sugar epimerase
MKVLVAGGSGFLGVEIIRNLIENGFEVRSFSRNISTKLNCRQIIADITEPESYQNIFVSWKPEIVIQAAWITNQKEYRTSPLNSEYRDATIEFSKMSYKYGVEHFLALGSCAEYGIPTERCNALTTSAAPVDNYGINKLQTLIKLQEVAQEYSGKLSWARIFQPYGPGQDLTRLLPYARKSLLAGKKVKVKNPNSMLDWISSRDVASAVTYAVKNEINEIFDVGTSIPFSIQKVLQTLCEVLNVDSNLIDLECLTNSKNNDLSVVVSKQSPIFKTQWRPQDDLVSGLKWAFAT